MIAKIIKHTDAKKPGHVATLYRLSEPYAYTALDSTGYVESETNYLWVSAIASRPEDVFQGGITPEVMAFPATGDAQILSWRDVSVIVGSMSHADCLAQIGITIDRSV